METSKEICILADKLIHGIYYSKELHECKWLEEKVKDIEYYIRKLTKYGNYSNTYKEGDLTIEYNFGIKYNGFYADINYGINGYYHRYTKPALINIKKDGEDISIYFYYMKDGEYHRELGRAKNYISYNYHKKQLIKDIKFNNYYYNGDNLRVLKKELGIEIDKIDDNKWREIVQLKKRFDKLRVYK